MNFDGKVVLITGASSGIGATTSIHFAALGAKLALIGRNAENLQTIAKTCADKSKLQPLVIMADVVKDAKTIIDKTIKHYGQLDVLVNNAGIGGTEQPLFETTSLEQFDKVMEINVRAIFQLTMLAIPHLLISKGNIVNVSSVAGIRSFPNISVYCISKAALDQFTKCVALELAAKGVRVNSVNPAMIRSSFYYNLGMDVDAYEKFLEHSGKLHPIGRVGTPDEVAAAITFLASDAASFITGTLLPVCGGKSSACPR